MLLHTLQTAVLLSLTTPTGIPRDPNAISSSRAPVNTLSSTSPSSFSFSSFTPDPNTNSVPISISIHTPPLIPTAHVNDQRTVTLWVDGPAYSLLRSESGRPLVTVLATLPWSDGGQAGWPKNPTAPVRAVG